MYLVNIIYVFMGFFVVENIGYENVEMIISLL